MPKPSDVKMTDFYDFSEFTDKEVFSSFFEPTSESNNTSVKPIIDSKFRNNSQKLSVKNIKKTKKITYLRKDYLQNVLHFKINVKTNAQSNKIPLNKTLNKIR